MSPKSRDRDKDWVLIESEKASALYQDCFNSLGNRRTAEEGKRNEKKKRFQFY